MTLTSTCEANVDSAWYVDVPSSRVEVTVSSSSDSQGPYLVNVGFFRDGDDVKSSLLTSDVQGQLGEAGLEAEDYAISCEGELWEVTRWRHANLNRVISTSTGGTSLSG